MCLETPSLFIYFFLHPIPISIETSFSRTGVLLSFVTTGQKGCMNTMVCGLSVTTPFSNQIF